MLVTIVDRFSKMVWFILPPKLPTAIEMAEALMFNVCVVYGSPGNVLFDQGPQFIVQFWERFCLFLDAIFILT